MKTKKKTLNFHLVSTISIHISFSKKIFWDILPVKHQLENIELEKHQLQNNHFQGSELKVCFNK